MIFTALHEAFFTYMKVAFFAAMFLAFPVIATQLWKFVAPGLYKHERRAFFPFLIATPVLFFMGGALAYYVVFPMAWHFFLSFEMTGEDGLPIQLEAKVDQYLSLVMQLIFAFGLCFEMPVVMSLLARAGLITAQTMREKRRYAIVFAFIFAAVLTPPDVISQVSLAIPTMLLYEISIWSVRLIERSREKAGGRGRGGGACRGEAGGPTKRPPATPSRGWAQDVSGRCDQRTLLVYTEVVIPPLLDQMWCAGQCGHRHALPRTAAPGRTRRNEFRLSRRAPGECKCRPLAAQAGERPAGHRTYVEKPWQHAAFQAAEREFVAASSSLRRDRRVSDGRDGASCWSLSTSMRAWFSRRCDRLAVRAVQALSGPGSAAATGARFSVVTYLLDTNSASLLEQVRRRFEQVLAEDAPVGIPAIVVFELSYGVARVQDGRATRRRWTHFWRGRCRSSLSRKTMHAPPASSVPISRPPEHRSAPTTP